MYRIKVHSKGLAQLVIIILPEIGSYYQHMSLKACLQATLEELNTPFVFIRESLAHRDYEHSRILYKSLCAGRSVPFVPRDMPILDHKPTMVIGYTTDNGLFSFTASLNKDLTHTFYSSVHTIEPREVRLPLLAE